MQSAAVNLGNISPILTQQELEVHRSAADMLPWVQKAASRFNTKALKAEAREGKHFARVLLDEALPMALFANRYYAASPQVTIRHIIGNQNYDAIVTDSRQCFGPGQHLVHDIRLSNLMPLPFPMATGA
jgi:hypothetical protein